MSGQIKLKAATLGGDITLAPTDTASNLVVTIPAVTATLLNNLSDIEAQVKTATSATGDAPIFSCRAFVNFNGTGTVAIRASGNVSSITDNSTGNYTVNFTTAMPDANYVLTTSSTRENTGQFPRSTGYRADLIKTTTAIQVESVTSGSTNAVDVSNVLVAIFR